MSEDLTETADRRLEAALEAEGARDPREFYRARLRELKSEDGKRYGQAVAYYRETLIPEVASGAVEPLAAWTEYGRRLAEFLASGRTVTIDATGRSHAYEAPPPRDHLILHLPDDERTRAILVGLPPNPTPPQRATYDVLVSGKQKLPG
ncbi:MAG: hypothetical protein P8170_03860 [Gemmatimonadota bacterium]|jgi:hypothetical protein